MLGGWSWRRVVMIVAAAGLAGVTGWLLAEGSRGVEIAAVLGFPIAVLGVLVAALGLFAAVRGTPVTPTPPPSTSPEERSTSPRWSIRRRIALAVVALVTLAATVAGVVIGAIGLTDSTDEPPEIGSAIQNPRDANPCLLIDSDALSSFGTPRLATSPWLEGCEFTIDTPDGIEARLRVQFRKADWAKSDYSAKIVQFEGAPACESFRRQADQPSISITAFSRDDEPIDLCAITRVATATVDNLIERQRTIPYTSNRAAGYSHSDHNACDTLDNATFSKHGLEPISRTAGFANWTCFWDMKDGTHVAVFFRLDEVDHGTYYGERAAIAEREAFRDTRENSCGYYVVHRSGPTATEMFHVTVEGPLSAERRCVVAADLATAVEGELRG